MREQIKSNNLSDMVTRTIIAKLSRFFDKITHIFAIFAALLLAFILIAVNSEVVMRSFFNAPIIWVTEVTEYCQVWITFLASAWVLKKGSHVVMDIATTRFNPAVQAYINTITSVVGILICLTIAYYSIAVTVDLFQRQVPLATTIMPPGYILFLVIPLGSILLAIQFVKRSCGYFMKRKTSIS